MSRKTLAILVLIVSAVSVAVAADNPAPKATPKAAPKATPNAAPKAQLSAAEIVNKNVAARGGLQAWRAVQTLTMTGTMGVGGNRRAALPVAVPGRQVPQGVVPPRPEKEFEAPFTMELARPRKNRLELQLMGQTAIQVYDGTNGWKLRPFLNRLEVENFTADEMKAASEQQELDGPLVDYAAKGTKIELEGVEKVENRDTYRLKLTMKNGRSMHVWIDAQTFLETKMEGQPRRLDGVDHPVEVYSRDYRTVDGLVIPYTLETKVLPVNKTMTGFRDTPVPVERITLDKVVVNPNLDQAAFSKPDVGAASKTKPAVVTTTPPKG